MKPLFVDKEKAEEISKVYPTPFYLYDEEGIRNNVRKLKDAFSWCDYCEHYAVKACPNPYILSILKEEGCAVDCSSYTELMLANACGFKNDEIMFSSNDTPGCDFRFARELDATINLDDISHIEFLEDNGGIPNTVCLRYNPGGEFSISGKIMGNPGDAKYGMTHDQILEAVSTLMSKGVKKFGLHGFLASSMLETGYYEALAGVLFKLAVEINEKTGAIVSFVNLSGGIGIPYKPTEKPVDIKKVGESVRKIYEEVIVPSKLGKISIKTELGRFVTGPYGVLVSRVIHEKNTYKNYIGLDACAANLMRPAMYGAYHEITVLDKENNEKTNTYDITGGLCENNDKFAIDRQMPKIEIGDIVVIHDAGAHGYAMGYNYNGKLRSAEILLKKDGSYELIRRAETSGDYFATFDFPESKFNNIF